MRVNELFENDVKGDPANAVDHPQLYHMTDYTGLSYSISNNSLRSKSSYLSTTYDSNMNSVGGRMHYHFKFILNGTKCLETYGGDYYKSYAHYTDGSGKHWYDEKEIGLRTRSIEPLNDFCDGLVIIINMFSRSFIQWMFYAINDSTSFTGTVNHSAAPKGIQSLHTLLQDWKKPLYVATSESHRDLTSEEKKFLNDCFSLIHQNVDFDRALYLLAQKYEGKIADHSGANITSAILDKEQYTTELRTGFNKLLASGPIDKIDPKKTRAYVRDWIKKLGYADRVDEFMKWFEQADLFNPRLEPIRWGSIFDNLIKFDEEDLKGDIEYAGEELARRVKAFGDDIRFAPRQHTQMWAG